MNDYSFGQSHDRPPSRDSKTTADRIIKLKVMCKWHECKIASLGDDECHAPKVRALLTELDALKFAVREIERIYGVVEVADEHPSMVRLKGLFK